jgi:tRNA pseudouridine55 synthase
MRRRNKGRNINGIVLLDKPEGISSNAALQEVKRLYRARKAGHTGSLDPLATGLLPVCLGEATKLSQYLLDTDKQYHVFGKLGVVTATGDTEGEVLEQKPVGEVGRDELARVLPGFIGDIRQVPPMYSALKHKGQPLYKLARKGIEVERNARTVHVSSIELLGLEGDVFELRVVCSRGTYIRTLVEDIGRAMGYGAHVVRLRRIGLGTFGEADMVTLEQLRAAAGQGPDALDALLRPVETALANWPQVILSDDAAFYLKQGQAVLVPHAPTSGWVCLFGREHRFLGLGRILDDGRVAPKRLLNLE